MMKNFFAMGLALALSLSLFGCTSAQAAEVKEETKAAAASEKETRKKENTAVAYLTEQDPFTDEEIQAFFKTQNVELVEKDDQEDRGFTLTHGICSDATEYYLSGYDGETALPDHFGFTRVDAELYNAYPIYASEWDAQSCQELRVHEMFETPKELSFCSVEDAEKEVRKALDALGLKDLELLRTLYLDKDTLRKANELVCEDPHFAPISDEPVPFNGYNLREWDEREEAYMFGFGMKVDDIPVTVHHRVEADKEEMGRFDGTEVVVWYNRHGIVNLQASAPFKAVKAQGKAQKLCSPDIAAKAAEEDAALSQKHDPDLKIEFEDPKLEYACVLEDGEYCLKPVWRAMYSMISEVEDYDDFTVRRQVFVDAITGEELINNS